MRTKTTWTLPARAVLFSVFSVLATACGDTGTPIDNSGASSGQGDAASAADSRTGAGSGASSGSSGSGSSGSGSSGSGSTSGDGGGQATEAGVVTPGSDAGSFDASGDSGAPTDGGANGDAGSRTDAGGTVHWATSVKPLLDGNCTNVCHGGCGNLIISYSSIVNVKSGEVARLNYVTPKDPGRSYLWCKINPTDTDCTREGTTILQSQMPPGGPYLSAADMATVKSWILQGALNN